MKVLLSIKPKFAESIFNGNKKYEFRRTIFKEKAIEKVVVYASSPVKKVIGEFVIEDILTLDIELLWRTTKMFSGISKETYYSYFAGKDYGHAIKVKNAIRFHDPIDLREYNFIRPPQSFAYIRNSA